MKEIRIAANNAILSLDGFINSLEYDISNLQKLEMLSPNASEYSIEKTYKQVIRNNLRETKKNLIAIVELDAQAENCMKDQKSKRS